MSSERTPESALPATASTSSETEVPSGKRVGKGLQDPEGALDGPGDRSVIEFEQNRSQASDQ